ncbi:MAG: hypothetical protein ABL962_18680, partial [Fimbriimonadaceae bacterium]
VWNAMGPAGTIINNTAFFDPGDIGLLTDDDAHYVAYNVRNFGWFCSEPVSLEAMDLASRIESGAAMAAKDPREFYRELYVELTRVLRNYNVTLPFMPGPDPSSTYELASNAAHISRLCFGAELMILNAPKEQSSP